MTSSAEIKILVSTVYVEAQSDPEKERFVFSYTINITNHGPAEVQLLNRHWIITDGAGEVEEVRGAGVVGKQPRLQPGQTFEYSSGAILKTPVGAMQGEYEFAGESGELFEVAIEPFTLSMPKLVH